MEDYARTPTIMVHGTDDLVMAPLANMGQFYEARWVTVRITKVLKDTEVPLSTRQALVGLEVDTAFTKEQMVSAGEKFETLLPNGARLTYANDIAHALARVGKREEADAFKAAMVALFKEDGWSLSMLVIEQDEYELAEAAAA